MVDLVTSLGQTVTVETRKIIGSDLSTVSTELNASHIPLSSTDSVAFNNTTDLSAALNYVKSLTGITGPRGEQGFQGIQGVTGATGQKGDKGDDGDSVTNVQQIDDNTIRFTVTDYAGTDTTYDFTLPQGPQGIQGIQGVPGVAGQQGFTGVPGADGANGADGVSITDVNQVNANTITFSLSDNSNTSSVTLPTPTADAILPSYTNNQGKVLSLNASATDIEWKAVTGIGTVQSVGISGSNGITVTGSPITSSGVISIGLSLGSNLTYDSPTGTLNATDTTYSVASTTVNGLMSAADRIKLNGISPLANNYALPRATSTSLGGIKVGTNLSITQDGELSSANTTYGLVTQSVAGLMSGGDKTKLDGIDTSANNYSLPIAAASTLGGIKVGTNLSIDGSGVLTPSYPNASQIVDGLMSNADKTKLDGIDTNANNYSLPTASSSVLGGIRIGTNLSIDGSGVVSSADTTYADATTTVAGLMSTADKTKLDGIDTNANNYSLPTASASVLGGIKIGTNLSIDVNGVVDSTDTTYVDATQSVAGLMSTSDKTKLDGIDTNANNYSLPTASGATLGGIKVGTDLTIDQNGVLSVQGGFALETQAIAYAIALG